MLSWPADHALRIHLPAPLIRAIAARLTAAPPPAARDITPAASTLLITFDPLHPGFDPLRAEAHIREAIAGIDPAAAPPGRTIDIPVCYDPEFAPDAADIARANAINPADIPALHSAAEYTVLFLGFSPGFGYLAGLPDILAMPRLDTPRPRVAPGSVGIAGNQTGIYPQATPGGWRLIGRTPLVMFDPARPEPALLAIGDRVRFHPISRAQFDELLHHPAI